MRSSPLIYLAPVLPESGPIDMELDRVLADVAETARHGNRTARDSLYWAVAGRLEPSMRRLYRLHVLAYGNGVLELQDVQQASYLVIIDMIDDWASRDSFANYLFGMFHWRLRNELRPYAKRHEVAIPEMETSQARDSAAAAVALERLLARLPERQRRIVQLRLTHNMTFVEISATLGISTRTIQRDMEAIERAVLRGRLA